MCCELGHLYNKEAILSALIDKSLPEHLVHIRGLKDVKTLRFTLNPAGEGRGSEDAALFICPLTKQEFGGLHPFLAIWSTGYVLSEKAVKEMGTEALQEEFGPFSAIDLVKLLPLESELDEQRALMHRRRELHKANKKEKKDKKEKKHHDMEEDVAGAQDEPSGKKRKTEDANPAASGLSKLSANGNVVQAAANNLKELEGKSEVFKSLFHKDSDKSKDKKDRDLFMNVAGLRYTLG